MRVALRLLGTRYGIAMVLTVLVLVVVATFRGVAGSRSPRDYAPALEQSSPASTGPTLPDDGMANLGQADGDPTPSLAPAVAADATTVADRFTAAWLNHTGVTAEQWLRGMTPYARPAVLTSLKGVDPSRVPATRVTGATTLTVRTTRLVAAEIPLDGGTLKLTLALADGRWLVSAVGWDALR